MDVSHLLPRLSRPELLEIQAACALAFIAMLIVLRVLRQRGTRTSAAGRLPAAQPRLLTGFLIALALVTSFNFFVLFRAQCCWYNPWDTFHTLLGSRYLRELGYDGLYPCALSFGEQAHILPAVRDMRDQQTLQVRPAQELIAEAHCAERFSTARREALIEDVRSVANAGCRPDWQGLFSDLGFQNTPFHAFLITGLSAIVGTSRAALIALSYFDDLVLLLGLLAASRAFGRSSALLCLICITTSIANYHFMAGSLRHVHLGLVIAALAAVKTKRHRLAGLLLGLAMAERIYPGVFALAYGLKLFLDGRAEQPRHRDFVSFLGAFVGSLGTAVVLGCLVGGAGIWAGFLSKMLIYQQFIVAIGVGARIILFFFRSSAWAVVLYYVGAALALAYAARVFLRQLSTTSFVVMYGLLLELCLASTLLHYSYIFALLFLLSDEVTSLQLWLAQLLTVASTLVMQAAVKPMGPNWQIVTEIEGAFIFSVMMLAANILLISGAARGRLSIPPRGDEIAPGAGSTF